MINKVIRLGISVRQQTNEDCKENCDQFVVGLIISNIPSIFTL
ncbi:hypothetical protein [Candidatus Enterovibrio escicola]|nr:hypothetical protein [Candidatus Enterovibrio escacola]